MLVRHHRALLAALILALGLRVTAMLGYPPALLFWADSFAYLKQDLAPGTYRPAGYSLFLAVLRPAHSLALVTAIQHLLGLALAVALYALLRRRGLPGWGATLAVLPLLFDEFVILLEHMIMADLLFMVLISAGVALLIWRVSPATAGVAGFLVGLAGITRTIGLPVLVLAIGYLLVKRANWRNVAALALAGAIPLASYATWSSDQNGKFALTGADGAFLWSRTMTFADCSVIKPGTDIAALCPTMPTDQRPLPPHWLWDSFSPLQRVDRQQRNELAQRFAQAAILAQPGDYLRAVGTDLHQLLRWERTASREETSRRRNPYWFPFEERPLKNSVKPIAESYEGGPAATRIVEPYAGWLRHYQRFGYLPFPVLVLILAGTLIAGLRQRRPEVLLPALTAALLLVAPSFVAAFDVRYVIPAIPLICLSTALVMARSRASALTAPMAVASPNAAIAQSPTERGEAPQKRSRRRTSGALGRIVGARTRRLQHRLRRPARRRHHRAPSSRT
ncbi:hypothetical protein ACFXJ8_11695 [Nonomuraea sp. NPDC059194]|uniref:hypothetical protein n=1 Tax=Nonomuraea sp. NPDC059194 TaxID=3346764 RepID=UPI0036AD348F